MVVINPIVWEFIPDNALSTIDENYGWLIGYVDSDLETNVFFAWDCQEFKYQTLISAEPKPEEFHKLAVMLPAGLGVIGMYHSHPHGSKIFHSHVDDDTVLDYMNMNKNFLSVVTNGRDIINYALVDPNSMELAEAPPKLEVPALPPETVFKVPVNLTIEKTADDLQPHHVTSRLADLIYQKWDEAHHFTGLPALESGEGLGEPLASLGDRGKNKAVEVVVDVAALNNPDATFEGPTVHLETVLTIPVFHDEHVLLASLDEKLRNKVLDRMTQRVLKGHYDADAGAWELAPVSIVRFFSVPLTLLLPADTAEADCAKFLDKMFRRFQWYSPNTIVENPEVEAQVEALLDDLRALAKQFKLKSHLKELKAWKKKLFSPLSEKELAQQAEERAALIEKSRLQVRKEREKKPAAPEPTGPPPGLDLSADFKCDKCGAALPDVEKYGPVWKWRYCNACGEKLGEDWIQQYCKPE